MIIRDLCQAMNINFLDNVFADYGFKVADRISDFFGKGRIDRQNSMIRLMARMGGTSYKELLKHPHGMTLTGGKQPSVLNELRHKDKKVHFAIPEFLTVIDQLSLEPLKADTDYPLVLSTTCRSWANNNTLIRNESWIAQNMTENYITLHPEDARDRGIVECDKVVLTTRTGEGKAPVKLTEDVLPGTVYLSHGWGLMSRDPSDRSGKMRGLETSRFIPDQQGDAFTGLPLYSGIPCQIIKNDRPEE